MSRAVRILAGLALLAGLAAPALAQTVQRESPLLAQKVAAGALPPLEQRLPETPRVIADMPDGPGEYGGTLTLLMGKARDVRQVMVYGYARLVGYTPDFEIVPDLAEAVDVEGERKFTFHLRKGHKWSDGQPFTAEDFRYFWEDVANNEELYPVGPPQALAVEGEFPQVSYPDDHTVIYEWSKPNPTFLHQLAGAAPLLIYRPAHYLKPFHGKYSEDKKKGGFAALKARNWASTHHRLDSLYKFENPEMPTLQPWHNDTAQPAERVSMSRNPYFHRVDAEGRQLPYIDEIIVQIASAGLIPAKAGAGEADLQARYLTFDDFTFLKRSARRENFEVHLWKNVKGAQLALYPNLNHNDPVWRELFRDVRFRRALSLGIDRDEINEVMYLGLALIGNNTVLPASPLYKPEYRIAWAQYDPDQANALLDEMGLAERNERGIRLLPDGRPISIIVETAGESTEQTDLLELVHDHWGNLGIKVYTKPLEREVWRNRIFAGETLMSIWTGLENGVPTPDMAPSELAPIDQNQLQWPKWGQYHQTDHEVGQPIDMEKPQRLYDLYEAWITSGSREERAGIWREMLDIHAQQQYTIGVIAGARQPVVARENLRNVPKEGIYNWDPGAYFGMYLPDTFWFDTQAPVQTGQAAGD